MKSADEVNIAVSLAYFRSVGRRACEGVAAYAASRPNWRIRLFDRNVLTEKEMWLYDGFIWDVVGSRIAKRLVATGKPVIDLTSDGRYPGTVGVCSDHMACGAMAARHFIDRHFKNFAFCGWARLRFSEERQRHFQRALQLNRLPCASYLSESMTLSAVLNGKMDVLTTPPDAAAICCVR